jgi:hypothetical protein
MDIEHWYFLSWFSRRGDGHEQDGETFFRAAAPLAKRTSGDPAMAFEPPLRRAGAVCARLIESAAGSLPAKHGLKFRNPYKRAGNPRGILQRRMPSFSISVL